MNNNEWDEKATSKSKIIRTAVISSISYLVGVPDDLLTPEIKEVIAGAVVFGSNALIAYFRKYATNSNLT